MEIRAIQKRLNELGFGPLTEDGKMGKKTIAAIKAFQTKNRLVVDGKVGKITEAVLFPKAKKLKMLSTAEIMAKYGQPGPSNLTVINLPYTMKIAWDLDYVANKIQCHRLIAEPLTKVFQDILAHYGKDKIEELGLDLYGGCYNFRKMRGGNEWSRHAWAIAIDLDPARNALKQSHKTAQFAKPEYKPMIDIFYKHGFVGLGPEEDRDWMHFQIGS